MKYLCIIFKSRNYFGLRSLPDSAHGPLWETSVPQTAGKTILSARMATTQYVYRNSSFDAFRCHRVVETLLLRCCIALSFTTALYRYFSFERLLVEVGEDVWSVHENGESAGQRDDSVDVEQQTIKYQRDILPVVDHLYTVSR